MSTEIVIEALNVNKQFGSPPSTVLKGINLQIHKGEFVALTGRSGSGKSTLLYILSSLDDGSSGDVRLSGQSVAKMTTQQLHEFRNQHMGFVFQFHYLLPELTALENVLMPAAKAGQWQQRHSKAVELLERFNLKGKLDRPPRKLSGGEQQRVAIARALVMEPQFLFADEPTGNLDSINGHAVMDILKAINKETKTTIVMVTHDREFAQQGSRQVHLVDGQITSN